MEPELKQRIIGTIVVTALAAIFIPMLFDEPVDDSGKAVSELTIPKPPVEADLAAKIPANKNQVLAQGNPELSASELNDEDIAPEGSSGKELKLGISASGRAQPGQDFIPPSEDDSGVKQKDSLSAVDEPVEDLNGQNPTLDTGDVDAAELPERSAKTDSATARVKKEKTSESSAAKVTSAENTKSVNKTKSDNKKKATSKLVRWSIQAGSFSKKENAQNLVEKLRKQGMPATIVTKGNLYRVKVGPELDKKKAAEMKAKLDRQNISSYLHSE